MCFVINYCRLNYIWFCVIVISQTNIQVESIIETFVHDKWYLKHVFIFFAYWIKLYLIQLICRMYFLLTYTLFKWSILHNKCYSFILFLSLFLFLLRVINFIVFDKTSGNVHACLLYFWCKSCLTHKHKGFYHAYTPKTQFNQPDIDT